MFLFSLKHRGQQRENLLRPELEEASCIREVSWPGCPEPGPNFLKKRERRVVLGAWPINRAHGVKHAPRTGQNITIITKKANLVKCGDTAQFIFSS